MATKDGSNFVALRADVHGDDERLRAILEGWGVEEDSIQRLLTEGRYRGVPTAAPRLAQPDETISLLRGGTPVRAHASH